MLEAKTWWWKLDGNIGVLFLPCPEYSQERAVREYEVESLASCWSIRKISGYGFSVQGVHEWNVFTNKVDALKYLTKLLK
jgi:hypothetical protein